MPTCYFPKPEKSPEFLLHVLLSMEIFQTESEISLHSTLSDSFRATKLVGDEINNEILAECSNDLMRKLFDKKLVVYPSMGNA